MRGVNGLSIFLHIDIGAMGALHLAPCTLYHAIVQQAMFTQLCTQPAIAHTFLHPVSVMGTMGAQGLGGGPS